MWSSSDDSRARRMLRRASLLALGIAALIGAGGCMSHRPNETDMPWAAPAPWEGTMPLPSGFMQRDY